MTVTVTTTATVIPKYKHWPSAIPSHMRSVTLPVCDGNRRSESITTVARLLDLLEAIRLDHWINELREEFRRLQNDAAYLRLTEPEGSDLRSMPSGYRACWEMLQQARQQRQALRMR